MDYGHNREPNLSFSDLIWPVVKSARILMNVHRKSCVMSPSVSTWEASVAVLRVSLGLWLTCNSVFLVYQSGPLSFSRETLVPASSLPAGVSSSNTLNPCQLL